ncbi:MAG: GntR family transcriptional regulator [Neisseriaceae bacterium]|nr:GntR family transcriptional regulator [Neisseriaceae bacterium]
MNKSKSEKSIAVNTATHSERVYLDILNSIIQGNLEPGAKISEQEIADAYGISRGPLREAINRLEGQKLVVRIPHVGARVVSLTMDELIELYQIRASLEGLACRLAAEKISSNEVDRLFKLLEKHRKNLSNLNISHSFTYDEDYDFHYRIIVSSGNEMLARLLGIDLYQLIRMYRQRFLTVSHRREQTFEEHYRIVEALQKKDGELAELLMKRHIQEAQAKMLQHFYGQKEQGEKSK